MKKGYWVVAYRSISDPAALQAYAALAGPAIAAGGGKALVRTSDIAEAHEAGLKERTVIVEFESLAKALAAHRSAGYQEALAALGKGAERDLRIMEGLE